MRAGSAPVTCTMTWLIRISESSSIPLARLTRVASAPRWPFQCSRLVRKVCDGTASSTVHAPDRASAGSLVARIDSGSGTSTYPELRWLRLISSASSGRRAHSVTLLPASANTFASAVPHAPAPITAASTTASE